MMAMILLLVFQQPPKGPTKAETLAWLKEQVRVSVSKTELVLSTRQYDWNECTLEIEVYAGAIDGTSPGVRDHLSVKLGEVGRILRNDMDNMAHVGLYAKNGKNWPGLLSSERVYPADLMIDMPMGDRVQRAVTHLATLCGATLQREPF